MNRTTIATLGLLAVLMVVGVVWVHSQPDSKADDAAVVHAPDRAPGPGAALPAGAPSLPDAFAETPSRLLLAEETVARPPAVALPQTPPPLVAQVTHADGRPAAGGRLAVYDSQRQRLAEGLLDSSGTWTGEGRDGPVDIFVLGLTPEPARFALPTGSGEHQLSLPAGTTLDGHLLISGAPPGFPFPLSLKGTWSEHARFDGYDLGPSAAGIPGEVTSTLRGGGFFTDPNGHFLLSGLQEGAEVELRWPRFYHPDASHPAPAPVVVPASGLVLALRRPPMLRGRIVTQDAQAANDARLETELRFERHQAPGEPGHAVGVASSQTLTFANFEVDAQGRFAIALGDPSRPTTQPPDPVGSRAVQLALQLMASTPDGRWVRVKLPQVDLSRDHDLGDLQLQPAERVVLEVVNPQGAPIVDARVRPESDRAQDTSLIRQTDAQGRVEIDLAVATRGLATIVAPGFRLAVVELPRPTSEDPLRVVLHPACSIHLILHGPFWQQDPSEDLWRFRYRISAPGGVFDDRRHPALSDGSQRSGPDDLREFLEGTVSSSGSCRDGDGTVSFTWTFDRPEWRFEALRPGHPLLLQIEIDRCPKSFGKAPPGVVWESVGVSLADGETRRIVVDLSGLQPGG